MHWIAPSEKDTAHKSHERRLAVTNLALRGIEADIGPEHADNFCDLQADLRGDYVRTNPPFNIQQVKGT